jgi:hypothetical protein
MEYKMKKHIVMASLVLLASSSAHSAGGIGLLSMVLGDKNVNVRYGSNPVPVTDAELYARRDRVLQRTESVSYFPEGRDTIYEQYIRLDDGRLVKKITKPNGCQVAYTGNMVCLPPEERIYYVKEVPEMPVAPGQSVTVQQPIDSDRVVVQAPSPQKVTKNKHVDPEEIPGKRREEIDGMPIQYGNESVGDSPCVGSSKECARRTNSIVN